MLCSEHDIQLQAVGELDLLPVWLRTTLKHLEADTIRYHNVLTLLIGYSARREILSAATKCSPGASFATFASFLWVQSPVHLILRTGGVPQIGDMLLLQSIEARLFFFDKLFPELTHQDIDWALAEFARRKIDTLEKTWNFVERCSNPTTDQAGTAIMQLDKEYFGDTNKKWQHLLLRFPGEAYKRGRRLHELLFGEGCVYLYHREKFLNLQKHAFYQARPGDYTVPYRVIQDGDQSFVAQAPQVALSPIFMSQERMARLADFVRAWAKAAHVVSELYHQDSVAAEVMGDEESMESTLNIPTVYYSLTPWSRSDIIRSQYYVDRNELPGGMFITARLSHRFREIFGDWLNDCAAGHKILSFDTGLLWETTMALYYEYCSHARYIPSLRPHLVFIVNRGSGLRCEFALAAEEAIPYFGSDRVSVVNPEELIYRADEQTLYANNQRVDIAFRFVRTPMWPWYNEDERAGIQALVQASRNLATCCIPPWKRYLASHAFPFLIQAKRWAEVFRAKLGENYYNILQAHLPTTGIVDREGWIVWPDGRHEQITEITDLKKYVLKRRDSTGGRGVIILQAFRSLQRQEVVGESLQALHDRQRLVIQEFVKPIRYPAFIMHANGLMKIHLLCKENIFSVNDVLLPGGSAMLAWNNLKIHGGSGTWLIPVFCLC